MVTLHISVTYYYFKPVKTLSRIHTGFMWQSFVLERATGVLCEERQCCPMHMKSNPVEIKVSEQEGGGALNTQARAAHREDCIETGCLSAAQ